MQFFNYFLIILLTSMFWLFLIGSMTIKLQEKNADLVSELRSLKINYNSLLITYNRLLDIIDASKPAPKTTKPLDAAYSALGLNHLASMQEVRNKYRILVKKYHPDVSKDKASAKRFKEVSEAYSLIKAKLEK
jgi:preprotein translocase subunit Sec63